jgi:hypothetical protein
MPATTVSPMAGCVEHRWLSNLSHDRGEQQEPVRRSDRHTATPYPRLSGGTVLSRAATGSVTPSIHAPSGHVIRGAEHRSQPHPAIELGAAGEQFAGGSVTTIDPAGEHQRTGRPPSPCPPPARVGHTCGPSRPVMTTRNRCSRALSCASQVVPKLRINALSPRYRQGTQCALGTRQTSTAAPKPAMITATLSRSHARASDAASHASDRR